MSRTCCRCRTPTAAGAGTKDCPSSVEETALAVEVLLDLAPGERGRSAGFAWLVEAVESGRFREPSPIGFYFAKLWYFEKLYPLIFTVAALGRAMRAPCDRLNRPSPLRGGIDSLTTLGADPVTP